MATIKDVANDAGVAVGTVSKVLNGLHVSEENKKKVEASVAKLGYQMNYYARGLNVVLGQTYGGYNRRADTEHQSDTGGDKKHGCHDVDGGEPFGTYAVAHKHAVADIEQRIEHHSYKRREKHGPEQACYIAVAEIEIVAVHK